MIEEMVKTIRAAEEQGDAEVARARADAQETVKQAELDAEGIRADAKKQAAADYQARMDRAVQDGEARLKEAAREEKEETDKVWEDTKSRRQAAVQAAMKVIAG